MRLIASSTILADMAFVHSYALGVPLWTGHHMKSVWLNSYRVSFQHPWQTHLFWTR